ncbi:MAG TPA: nuclear transport factor 2 family protein [Chloroflexota bacterium]|nr:nuclear transport factor 2 family protein [Chloroflexota bacterium]
MHVVLRQYKVDPSAVDEIVRRAREGFVPLISAAPGFVSYTISDGGAEGVTTIGTFEDQTGAEESIRLAADWVKDNLAALLPDPPRITSGEAVIREVKEGAQLGYGVMRRYQFKPGDVAEVTRLVREGLVPRIASAPGFCIYTVLDAGDGVAVSLSGFTDQASAEVSSRQTLAWVREHLGSFHPEPPQVIGGVIKLRHTRADAVRQASDRFYAALNAMANGDAGPMSAIWAHSGDVTTMHPIGHREVGWEQVRPTWEQVASIAGGGQIRLRDQLIRVGTDLAYEVAVEEGEITMAREPVAFNQRVTNIYRREGGEWKIIHHHSDPSPAANDLLSRLQSPLR